MELQEDVNMCEYEKVNTWKSLASPHYFLYKDIQFVSYLFTDDS